MNKIIVTTTIATLLTGSVLAVTNNPRPVESQVKTPIEIQVDNHEERIGALEEKTDSTQTQVNQNSADITVLKNNTGTNSTSHSDPVQTPENEAPTPTEPDIILNPVVEPTPIPDPIPEPTPEPIPTNPKTIVAVTDTPRARDHACIYTLYDGRKITAYTGNTVACQQVGEILTGVNGY